MLEPFIPKLQEIDLDKDKRPIGVAKILAETASIRAAADWVMDREPWDFMAVYHDAIDHFGHGFMKYHHPRQDWIPGAGLRALLQHHRHGGLVPVLRPPIGENPTKTR